MASSQSVANPDRPPGRSKSTPPEIDDSREQLLRDTSDVTGGLIRSHSDSVDVRSISTETLQKIESLYFASPSDRPSDQGKNLSPSKYRYSDRRKGGIYNIDVNMAQAYAEGYQDAEETPRARITEVADLIDFADTLTAPVSSSESHDSWALPPPKRLIETRDTKHDVERAEEFLRNQIRGQEGSLPYSTTQPHHVDIEHQTSDHSDGRSVELLDLSEAISDQWSSGRPTTAQSSDLETSGVANAHVAFNKILPRPARGESGPIIRAALSIQGVCSLKSQVEIPMSLRTAAMIKRDSRCTLLTTGHHRRMKAIASST